nr:PREDICTED: interleukin-2 receptor subunit alpha [Anolis carolinensis]|eukprot:XP_008108495.1 PREDICTED: interleukin-2 receptor subunit alpha [Anolis carolinensis]
MGNFCIGFGLFLMWGTIQTTFGAGKGECPFPQTIEFAEYFAEWYVLGTVVRYDCELGYKRLGGRSNRMTCEKRSTQAQWTCRFPPNCTAISELTSRASQKLSTEASEGRYEYLTDGCRLPRPLKHATVKVAKYLVGQTLQYRCLDGYHAWSPISGNSTCQDFKGKGVWSRLSLRCANDSSSVVTEGIPNPSLGLAPSSKSSSTEDYKQRDNGSQSILEQVMEGNMNVLFNLFIICLHL